MTKKLAIDENDLYEVYDLLADATTAASTGNTNDVSKFAAEAKRKLNDIHETADVVDTANDRNEEDDG